ncbi:MAG: hypothetical protein FWC66_02525 [Oscillospiraceae bacterium]|nr:hypothetical protein [Oscillospiraceae bacterium]
MNKKKPTFRERVTCAIFIGMIGIFFLLNLIIPPPEVLVSERRSPARFPELSVQTIMSGSFMTGFDDYAADRFVFRDSFRAIKAFFVLEIMRMNDKSGIYNSDAVGVGQFRRVDATAFGQTSERIKRAAQIFDGQEMNIFYSIVPDKSIFAERFMPGFNLELAESILFDVLGDYEYIRLYDSLSAETFYKTDLHWDQAMIRAVTSHILTSMGANAHLSDFPINTVGEWRGVYAGQLALPVLPDLLRTVEVPGLTVRYLNERTLEFEEGSVYDLGRFTGIDPYDVFLRGPQPLIIIENDSAPKRNLYLFRDSFGSSLAPLMMEAYSTITVIDLRYINLQILDQFIEFTPGSDVLFIFSSQIFNNPSVLQA